jgi:BirA family biotin operon repressor/biotin-[acetyl-CoA-carboxylase] ligase
VSERFPPLDRDRLEVLLAGTPWIRRLVLVEAIASTNDLARELAAQGAPSGTVVLAESQSAGRGRHGRSWHSPAGVGLYVSVLLRPRAAAPELTRWTLGAAVAACESCRGLVPAAVEIRWPNDLLGDGRKLGGVLAECRTGGGPSAALVLGTGLNVAHRAEDFPPELRASATSLALLARGAAPTRERVAASYLAALGQVARELEDGRWEGVRARFEALAPGARGRRVRVAARAASSSYEGYTAGLDALGALQVRRPDGALATVRDGEAVRPAGAGEA